MDFFGLSHFSTKSSFLSSRFMSISLHFLSSLVSCLLSLVLSLVLSCLSSSVLLCLLSLSLSPYDAVCDAVCRSAYGVCGVVCGMCRCGCGKPPLCGHHAHMLKHMCAWCQYTRGTFWTDTRGGGRVSSPVLHTKICLRRVITWPQRSTKETHGSYPFSVWEQVENNMLPSPPIIRFT